MHVYKLELYYLELLLDMIVVAISSLLILYAVTYIL